MDVKRLWSLRQTLLLMDFEDESSCSLKDSLLQCLVHPVFLKGEEVRTGNIILLYNTEIPNV